MYIRTIRRINIKGNRIGKQCARRPQKVRGGGGGNGDLDLFGLVIGIFNVRDKFLGIWM